jgi:hypothetical protein
MLRLPSTDGAANYSKMFRKEVGLYRGHISVIMKLWLRVVDYYSHHIFDMASNTAYYYTIGLIEYSRIKKF